MAVDRFLFWRGYYDAILELEDDALVGKFMKALCAYAFDGLEPELNDATLRFAWLMVRDSVRESVEIGRQNSENGKRGGRPRNAERTARKSAAKSPAKSGAKSGAKSPAESGAKSAAESVRYGKVPISTDGCAHSDSRPVRACGEPWPTHVRDWTTDLVEEWKAWAPTGDPEWWAAYQGGTRPGPWLEALA